MLRRNEFEDEIYEISGAPDVGSLDELLVGPENAYACNINKPHIRVETSNLVNVMAVSKKVSEKTGRDLINRTIGIKASSGKLQLFFSNQDEYAEVSLKLDNQENILEDFIPISFYHLHAIIHSCFDYFVLYKDKGSYFVKILGGDIELDTVKDIKQGQMEIKKKKKYTPIGLINTEDFKMVKKCGLLAKNSISRSQKRVFINNNEVIGCSMESILIYESKNKLPNIIFRLKDVEVINLLIRIYKPNDLKITINEERTLVYNDSFTYSFCTVNCDTLKSSYAVNTSTIQPISIMFSELEKLGFLSEKYPNSRGRLRFNYTEDGQIQCLVLLKNLNFKALLRTDSKNKNSKLDEDLKISTMRLNAILSCFDSKEVNLFLTKESLIIRSGEISGICYESEEI